MDFLSGFCVRHKSDCCCIWILCFSGIRPYNEVFIGLDNCKFITRSRIRPYVRWAWFHLITTYISHLSPHHGWNRSDPCAQNPSPQTRIPCGLSDVYIFIQFICYWASAMLSCVPFASLPEPGGRTVYTKNIISC